MDRILCSSRRFLYCWPRCRPRCLSHGQCKHWLLTPSRPSWLTRLQIELNTDCYQYSYGYPNLLNADGMIGTNPNRKFQYLGCSGAKVPDITTKQVPKMGTSQVVTISAGGNDAHLATILNYCIYQWATWWPWTCNGELKSAENAINADQYTKDLQDLMTAVKPKLQNENSRIYWVGYEQFWDTSTNECDSVTWAFTRNWGFREYLTQDRRYSKLLTALAEICHRR